MSQHSLACHEVEFTTSQLSHTVLQATCTLFHKGYLEKTFYMPC